jgi:HD-GYP domain-containing protein (c-di-GMP phosphodiesterase class II)
VASVDDGGEVFARLAIDESHDGIGRAVAAARELLELDIEYVSSEQPAGDPAPGVLRVPVRDSTGHLHGTLSCSAVSRFRPLTERDGRSIGVLARLLADRLEHGDDDLERMHANMRATGLRALLAAVEARDAYTGDHCQTVVDLSMKVARRLGLGAREILDAEQLALLHDVGKVAVPDAVLQKTGVLTTEELGAIKAHPEMGERIVSSVPGVAHLAPAIRACHERWDGTGYPDGLRGEEIPLVSRIALVCDAYDAMTSDRPYRKALGRGQALQELRRGAGRQFCRRSVDALVATLEAEGGRGVHTGVGA